MFAFHVFIHRLLSMNFCNVYEATATAAATATTTPIAAEEEKTVFTTSIQFLTAVAAAAAVVAVSSFLFCSLHGCLLFIFLLIYMASVCYAARILRCHDIVEFY